MKKNEFACAVALALGLSSALAAPAASTMYECVALKAVGNLNTLAMAVSPDGHVAGTLVGTDGADQAALWYRDLLTMPDQMSDGYAVNDRGDMAGAKTNDPALLNAGVVSRLPKLSSWGALASGIDGKGRVVGGSISDQSTWRAVWWVDGVVAELGTLGNDPRAHSHASAINRYGDIVGMSQSEDHFSIDEAVLWKRRSLQIITLPKPTPEGSAEASAINDGGLIVGHGNYLGGRPDRRHALAWKNHGTVIDLGTLPSGTTSRANAVRSDGVIVGHSSVDAAATDLRATVWYGPGRKPIDLNTRLVGPGCFNFQTGDKFVLYDAKGIADDGTIVANGKSDGATPSRLAFRLVPQ